MAYTITHKDNEAFLGDIPHLEKSSASSFAAMVFELLSERIPTDAERAVFELILNLSVDHGPDTPSAKATITAAQSGESIGNAVALGIREINTVHGGAQEELMNLLLRIKKSEATPVSIVTEYKTVGKKLPGFGHRIYTTDPRTEKIFALLASYTLATTERAHVEAIQSEIESQLGKKLPINIDGAIAVALTGFGWKPKLGIAVFIIARTAGLCGHFINNQKTS